MSIPRTGGRSCTKKNGWRGVAEGAGRIFFAYIGFDSISTHAEEARRPQRDLAIGIMGALDGLHDPLRRGRGRPDRDGPLSPDRHPAPRWPRPCKAKGLTFAGGLITLGILAGMTSSLLVGNLSQPRILLAMARDGLLPQGIFAAVHPRFKTPWKSTILVGVVVAAAAALAPLEFLADLVSIGTLFAFVVVSAAVWILRITDPDGTSAVPRPVVPFVSTMGMLVNGGMMFSSGRRTGFGCCVWLVLGLLIYFGYRRRHSALRLKTARGTCKIDRHESGSKSLRGQSHVHRRARAALVSGSERRRPG